MKKEYTTPRFVRHGTVEDLTLRGRGRRRRRRGRGRGNTAPSVDPIS